VDVADGLLYFCGRREQPMLPAFIRSITQPFLLERDRIQAFGWGYGQSVALTEAEFAVLPNLLRARWLFSRVDAMERKIPELERVAYLLDGIEPALAQIDAAAAFIAGGSWSRSTAGGAQ
jgi:Ser/Thr protein kinase RdoA (MazF antagonist)